MVKVVEQGEDDDEEEDEDLIKVWLHRISDLPEIIGRWDIWIFLFQCCICAHLPASYFEKHILLFTDMLVFGCSIAFKSIRTDMAWYVKRMSKFIQIIPRTI